MLVVHPAVRAADARGELNAAIRYAVVRLAELLDPASSFALAGCAYCDPIAAAGEFASAARDYLEHPGVRQGTVLAASQFLSDALRQETNLQRWYPGEVIRLRSFLGQLRKVPTVKSVAGGERHVPTSQVERAAWVRQQLRSLVAGSLARFEEAVGHPCTGYRARLVGAVLGRLACAPDGERDWAELDHDLCYLAALCLGEGHDGGELAVGVARQVSAAADDADAVRRVKRVLAAEPALFDVALVLDGARAIAPASAAAFDVTPVDRVRPRWPAGASPSADAALARFVARRAPPDSSTPLLVTGSALDRVQARVLSLLAAEALRDRLVVEHRVSSFSIRPVALVRRRSAGPAVLLGEPPVPLAEARVTGGDVVELRPFFRACALARDHPSPGVRVAHTWIALECLAERTGQGPRQGDQPAALATRLDAYLPSFVAGVTAMTGLSSQLETTWTELREVGRRSSRRRDWRQLEAWLGTAGRRTRFVELLRGLSEPTATVPSRLEPDAPPAAAAAFLLDLTGSLGPFLRRRLETLGRQLDHGSRLAKAAEAVQVRALVATARLKLARHLAVHQGAEASGSLALSGLHLLNGAFEVLRRWARPGERPAAAMSEARRWHDHNLVRWRRSIDPEIDADHLLHPIEE